MSKFKSCPGSRIKEEFELRIDENGQHNLVKTGEFSLYDQIQADRNATDIELIVRRFLSGDTSALEQVQGTYGDFTDMPKSMIEAQNMIIHAKRTFDQLPVDVKQSFGNNADAWIAQLGSKDWIEKMKVKQDDKYVASNEIPVEPIKNEVKE